MKVVAFDVDGTLIEEPGDKPRADIIEKLIWHFQQGDFVVVWSGGGLDYARMWVSRLGLDKYIHAIWPKQKTATTVDVTYDDQIVKLGKENILVGPGNYEERW